MPRPTELAAQMTDFEVWQLGARLLDLVNEKSSDPKTRVAFETKMPVAFERRVIRERLVDVFAARHGWVTAKKDFPNIDTLIFRLAAHGKRESYGFDHEMFDHHYAFREPQRPYRAAALAANLYSMTPERKLKLEKKADDLGLLLSWPDFPSWWYPTATTLALYQPKYSVDEIARMKAKSKFRRRSF